ncbi:MAG: rhodanese-like domain-containing protein [Desulfopila sp.]
MESYIAGFDYEARKDMKIDSKELVKGLEEGKIQLIDIRFKEEFQAWRMGFGINIPLNELPARLNELQKDKIIVTACPHKDRAGLAMAYLRTKGYNSKYLVDGLVGLAEYLRGDKARDFVNSTAGK